jgi:hypothetical protein
VVEGGVAVAEKTGTLPLKVVDGLELPEDVRRALRPAGMLRDRRGQERRLPRFFYEVPSWEAAREVQLAEHFMLWEFMSVDVKEAAELIEFPRYVPCAVALVAAPLELLRQAVGRPVHIAANGGYRSPAHRETRYASLHCWGTAANIYRIGEDYLLSRELIERYGRIARSVAPWLWIRPWGSRPGEADDHLHVDLGYAELVPREARPAAAAPLPDTTAPPGTEA